MHQSAASMLPAVTTSPGRPAPWPTAPKSTVKRFSRTALTSASPAAAVVLSPPRPHPLLVVVLPSPPPHPLLAVLPVAAPLPPSCALLTLASSTSQVSGHSSPVHQLWCSERIQPSLCLSCYSTRTHTHTPSAIISPVVLCCTCVLQDLTWLVSLLQLATHAHHLLLGSSVYMYH